MNEWTYEQKNEQLNEGTKEQTKEQTNGRNQEDTRLISFFLFFCIISNKEWWWTRTLFVVCVKRGIETSIIDLWNQLAKKQNKVNTLQSRAVVKTIRPKD